MGSTPTTNSVGSVGTGIGRVCLLVGRSRGLSPPVSRD